MPRECHIVGLGSQCFHLAMYIANRPCNDHYPTLDRLQPLEVGELQHIVANNTNHWRKVFNVYAKLLFELDWPTFVKKTWPDSYSINARSINAGAADLELTSTECSAYDSVGEYCHTWQHYRDNCFLQHHSAEALLFSPPDFSQPNVIHVVAGKAYANELDLPPLHWLDHHFAINKASRLIVCPYLDYRQLSNERITRLVELIKSLV